MRRVFILVTLLWSICMKGQVLKDTAAYASTLNAYQYQFIDSAGVQHSLSEFKGKYLYLDIWASWCYPCRKEYPYLKELEKVIDARKVAIVSVSIDQQAYRWKGGMAGYGINEGVQWLAGDTSFEKAFCIDRIPRFIMLDKKGKVMEFSMSRPSNEQTITFLKNLK